MRLASWRCAKDGCVHVRVTPLNPPVAAWKPVDAYFCRVPEGWRLVGLDRDAAVSRGQSARRE